MEQKNNHYCSSCGKKLRVFPVNIDWNKRMLHKSCWKKHQDEISMRIMLQEFQEQESKEK